MRRARKSRALRFSKSSDIALGAGRANVLGMVMRKGDAPGADRNRPVSVASVDFRDAAPQE
jgi:hypothetical protein